MATLLQTLSTQDGVCWNLLQGQSTSLPSPQSKPTPNSGANGPDQALAAFLGPGWSFTASSEAKAFTTWLHMEPDTLLSGSALEPRQPLLLPPPHSPVARQKQVTSQPAASIPPLQMAAASSAQTFNTRGSSSLSPLEGGREAGLPCPPQPQGMSATPGSVMSPARSARRLP